MHLRDLRGQPVLLHFVSYTCPVTRGAVAPMKRLHDQYGDRVTFVDIVVRQAHPGKHHDAYVSLADKMSDARDYQREEAIAWPVAVDDLTGTVQRAPHDVGLQLLENSTATAFGLAVLILMLGPVSGAHFNPVVSLADWFLGRRTRAGLTLREVGAYTLAQCAGGIGGACWPTSCSMSGNTCRPRTGPAAGTCSARSSPPPDC